MPNKVVSLEDRLPKLKEQRRKRANRRLIILLFIFFLFLAGFIYIQSPLSRVGELTISGNQFATKEKIMKASKLTDRTIVLNVRKGELKNRILQVPEVKNAKIEVAFPNKITIHIEEYKQLAYIYEQGQAKPLLENGYASSFPKGMTRQPGPILKDFNKKESKQMVIAQLKQLPDEIRLLISQIIYSPKSTDSYNVIAYMNDGNEIHATLRTFADKMIYYPQIVKKLDPKDKGIIDLEVGAFFKSYESIKNDKKEESGEDSEN